jgi:hypothetical protein
MIIKVVIGVRRDSDKTQVAEINPVHWKTGRSRLKNAGGNEGNHQYVIEKNREKVLKPGFPLCY